MRRLLSGVFVLVLALGGASCDDNPTEPSPEPTPTFSFALTSANEVPPISGAEASCAGTVTIELNLTRDSANTITAANTDISATITGCPSTTNITVAHIHEAAAGQIGSPVVNTGISSGQVALNSNGAGSFTREGLATTPEVAQRILDNPAGFYFNIHSTANSGGVIRGQLVRTQ